MPTETNPGVYEGLSLAAGEMKAIPKDQRNKEQNFDFRSIESIVGHAKPLLEKYQLAIVPIGFEVLSTEQVQSSRGTRGWRTVVAGHWQITHVDGSMIEASMLGEAVDYGDKSASKAVQMAYKYLLTQLLGIGSEDPDGITPEAAVDDVPQVDDDTPPAPDMAELIRTKVAIFKEWSEDDRRVQWLAHSKKVLQGKPKNVKEVDKVIKSMGADYYEQHPSPDLEAPF